MFDFISMANNHNERKVDRYEDSETKLIIDTCSVNDSTKEYETAISHPRYNKGKWIIVALYDTKKQAKKGHQSFIKKMTAKILPENLKDVSTAKIVSLFESFDNDKSWRNNKCV